jgi:hypothetical protein
MAPPPMTRTLHSCTGRAILGREMFKACSTVAAGSVSTAMVCGMSSEMGMTELAGMDMNSA